MINNIENRIKEDYWISKTKDKTILTVESGTILSTSSLTISSADSGYFKKLTGNKFIVEYTVLIGIYGALLKRYFSNREGIIYTVNNLDENRIEPGNPLLIKVDSDANSLKEYLQQVKREIQEVYNYADYDLISLHDKSGSVSFNSITPFSFHYAKKIAIPEIKIPFQLNFVKHDSGDIDIRLYFVSNFIETSVAEHFLQNFKKWILNIEVYIQQPIKRIPLLSDPEKHHLLTVFNETSCDYPRDHTIVSLFESNASKYPDAIVSVFGGHHLSYRSLNESSNQLANYLRNQYLISSDDIIVIMMSKSNDFLIAMLAVLKLGAVYLPLDPKYPEKRKNYILKDSRARLVICDQKKEELDVMAVSLDELMLTDWSAANLNLPIYPNDVAYIIYTSGSTGMPKGVMIEHTSNINMSLDQIKIFNVISSDRIIWFASVAFDASVSEIMMALYAGATLLIPEEEVIIDQQKFKNYLKESGATIVTFPPSYLDLLSSSDVAGLKCIITAGETASVSKAVELSKHNNYFNAYGPTECAVCATTYKVSSADSDKLSIPIGKPIANLSVYILDQYLEPVPVGVEGTIYISGVGVGRGYLNNPVLTAEKFIPDLFSPGHNMYDTGDIGKWMGNGNIVFLGRKDEQVKIRGHRIEPGEIEHALFRSDSSLQQVVVVVKTHKNQKVLVAYYVSSTVLNKEVTKDKLSSLLPEFMIPSFFVKISKLPLTPNGKVDKNALREPGENDLIREKYTAAVNPTERMLISIWEEILEIEKIGTLDDFFMLGGNSLMMTRIASAIRELFVIDIPVKTLFTHTTVKKLSDVIINEKQFPCLPLAVTEARPENIPLSYSQESLWLTDRIEGSIHYQIPILLKLEGDLDTDALEYAFSSLINRHEILRTVIVEEGNQVYQKIISKDHWRLEYVNEGKAENFINSELSKSFDLSKDHMLRAGVIRLNNHEHLLMIVMHHIISDGWSMFIFVNELTELYQARKEERPPVLPELIFQYADYAVWQRNFLNGSVLDEKLCYWENQLSGLEPLDFPTDFPHAAVKSIRGKALNFQVEKNLTDELKRISVKEESTLYMTLLAAIKVLLYRYTGQSDICVGSPVANRGQRKTEPLIGFFVNTLAMRTGLQGNPSFTDLLARVKETCLAAFAHQDVPFEKVISKVENGRNPGSTSLFQSLFVFQNNRSIKTSQIGAVNFSVLPIEQQTVKFDLTFSVTENITGMEISIQYCSDLFLPETILRIKGHLEMLLKSIASDPSQRIGDMQMLLPDEEKQLLLFPEQDSRKYTQHKTVLTLFEEQAEKTPDAVAVIFEGIELTYRQVDEQSDQLANYLRKQVVRKGDMVLLCLGSALESTITGILGIIKAGAVYVPLDPDYPDERISFIQTDTKAQIVICDHSSRYLFDQSGMIQVIIEEMRDQPISKADGRPTPEDLIYVIYTSGSTGIPKGVMITHNNLTDYLNGLFSKTDIRSNRSYGLMSTIATDLGNTVLFSAIASGSTLHLFSRDILTMAGSIHSYFQQHTIDCIKIVPSYWKSLEADAGFLYPARMIIFGGEELSGELIREIRDNNPAIKIINHYGPTETTIGKLLYQVDNNRDYSSVPIGKVFSDSIAYIVDRDFSLCPAGVSGELLIGGKGLAKGYLNNPDLTEEKFIDNPFCRSEKLYRTGDLVKRLPDGNIIFKGRIDTQIKIRGYRVEPGEVISLLVQCTTVKQCAVIDHKDTIGNNQLIAYLVVSEGYSRNDVKTYLKERLPAYMIPAMFIELVSIPLTSNGKIDRKLLPDPLLQNHDASDYQSPKTATEQLIAKIWRELLGIEKIGINDNFFELGGNSLIAIRLTNNIEKLLGVKMALRDVFSHSDIYQMGRYVDSKEQEKYSEILKIDLQDDYELSSNQLRLWMACQYPENAIAYNISGGLIIDGNLDITSLKEAYLLLTERHDSLRTVFINDNQGLPRQKILDTVNPSFEIGQMDTVPEESILALLINQENSKPFTLLNELLVRVKVISLTNNNTLLLVVMHHMISDGWSMNILIKDWIILYNSIINAKEPELPALKIQYKDFTAWQKHYFNSARFKETIEYWKERLSGNLPILNLPLSYARTDESSSAGEGFEFSVDDSLYERLKELSLVHKTTLFTFLFTAFNALLYHISNQRDIILGTSTAGRRHSDLEVITGFFVNTLVIKTTVDPKISFIDLLAETSESLLNDFAHQDMPFEKLITYLDYKRLPGVNPIFQTRFVMNDDDEHTYSQLQNSALKMRRIIPKEINSKFDLSLVMRSGQRKLSGIFEYKYSLFKKEAIQLMITSYVELLENITKDPFRNIDELNNYREMVSEIKNTNRLAAKKNNLKTLINTLPKRIGH